jgi:hypothetical protein
LLLLLLWLIFLFFLSLELRQQLLLHCGDISMQAELFAIGEGTSWNIAAS